MASYRLFAKFFHPARRYARKVVASRAGDEFKTKSLETLQESARIRRQTLGSRYLLEAVSAGLQAVA